MHWIALNENLQKKHYQENPGKCMCVYRDQNIDVVCLEDGTLVWHDQGTEGIAHKFCTSILFPPRHKTRRAKIRGTRISFEKTFTCCLQVVKEQKNL